MTKLMPWGKAFGYGIKRGTMRKSRARQSKPDSSLFSVAYPPNKPGLWPIEGGKRKSNTAPTTEQADRHRAIVNMAFKRAGYDENNVTYGWGGMAIPASPQPQTMEREMIAIAEHIARMDKAELQQICALLNLDVSGTKEDLANRVLAHTDVAALAAAVALQH